MQPKFVCLVILLIALVFVEIEAGDETDDESPTQSYRGSETDNNDDVDKLKHKDFLWHKDEIPYEPRAKCQRGVGYYTNSINAADTDINVPDSVNSLLDYSNKDICFYCICSTSGREVRCVTRNVWFCEYVKSLRNRDAMRIRYENLFQQDRPGYFRTLSYRLRRTMDYGLMDMVDYGGDSLCCSHSDGHRRSIHNRVRAKLRLLRRKLPKENLMEKADKTRGDYDDFIVNNDK